MALEGISNSDVNKLLKDPKFSKSLLKMTDPKAYRKLEAKEDKMNVLERMGELLSFDEWSDDMVRMMRRSRNPETGKVNALRSLGAGLVLPFDYAASGVRKIAGAVTGSKKISNYDSPRGKDIIPEAVASNYAMLKPKEYQELKTQKGSNLDSSDFDTIMEKQGLPKGVRTAAKIGSGAVGLAADTVGTPSFWLSGATASAAKKASMGEKVIREGVKASKAASFAELVAKHSDDAYKIAGDALQKAGLESSADNIAKMVKSSNFLRQATKEAAVPGLYKVGPLSKDAKLLKAGKNWDVVARYIDNPLMAALGDVWSKAKAIPIPKDGDAANTLGKNVDNIVDAVKEKLTHGYAIKKFGGDEIAYHFDALEKGFNSADFESGVRKDSLIRHLNALREKGAIPPDFDITKIRQLREYMTGNPQNTQFGQFLKNMPNMSKDQLKVIYDKLDKYEASQARKAGGALKEDYTKGLIDDEGAGLTEKVLTEESKAYEASKADLLKRIDETGARVKYREMDETQGVPLSEEELDSFFKGDKFDWEAFSRKRGYPEEDIADLKEHFRLLEEAQSKFGIPLYELQSRLHLEELGRVPKEEWVSPRYYDDWQEFTRSVAEQERLLKTPLGDWTDKELVDELLYSDPAVVWEEGERLRKVFQETQKRGISLKLDKQMENIIESANPKWARTAKDSYEAPQVSKAGGALKEAPVKELSKMSKEPIAKEIDDLIKQGGLSEEVAEMAVTDPTGYEYLLKNEFEKAYYPKYAQGVRESTRMSLADERMLADPANFNVTENPVITKARLEDLAASGDEVSIKEYKELLKKKPILKYVDKNGAFSLDAFKERIGKPDFVPLPEESVRALTSELEMLQGQVGMGKKTLARIAQIEKALEYQPEYFKTKFRVGKWIEENAFEKRTLKAATPEARIALAKKYASSVPDAEVEDVAQKIFERDFPGAKLKDVENGRFDEVESLLKDYGIKGQDAIDFKNEATFADIADKLEQKVGYLQKESGDATWTAGDLRVSLQEEIGSVQNALEKATDASDKAILEGELEELKEMAVVNELISNNSYTKARAMVTGMEEPDMRQLYNNVFNENGKNIYAVTGTGDNLKTWQRTDFRTDWEKYLENARKRVGAKIMEAQQRAVKKDLAGRMVAMVDPKTMDDKIRVTKESDDAIEAVVRSSDIDTGGQLTGAEEQLSTVFGRDTMVADIDPETLGTILDEMGVKGLGKERIITAVGAFKAEMAQEEQLNQQLIEWLSKSAVSDAQKQEIVDLVGSLKGSATLDFSIKENRKAMLKNVLTLEQKIDEVGKMDAQAGKMAAFLKEALTRPMKDHAAGWLRRQKTGLDTLGYLGVGHRSMDVAEELQKPGVGKMVSEADRVVYNEATAKAYNAVIGSDGYKLKDDVDSFAEDIIGYQIKQDGRLYALQNNTVEMLKTIKEGNAGPGIVIAKDGVGLNPKEWKLVKDIPIFKDAQVYVKNEIYPEFEAMGKFYADKEPRDFMKYAKFINNIWKGVQTGGGANLPQIKGKVYEQAKRMGMQGFIDYYNSNMAFLPLSHAFTSRNILGNYIAVKLNTGMSNKEVWEYLNKAAQVQRSLKVYMGEEDMNQGLWGILKGGYSQKQLETLVGDLKASGIPETSYKAQEGMGAITDSLGELGKGKQIVKDITEGLVEGRSMKYNESMENLWKTMVFLYERDSGKSIPDATRAVHKALFDYSALTPFEKEYIKPYTVFYTWTKKNVEMMLDIMENKPQTFKAYAKGTLEPRGQFTNMTPEEQAQMPEWTRSTIGIPYKSNGDSKFLSGYGGNLESLSEWVGSGGTDIAGSLGSIGQQSIDMLAPTFKVPFNTLITKRNTFKDVPLDEDTSAYGYRALPKFMRDALGITQRKWVDRNGKEGVTYEMDGNKKYLIESSLGRATTVPLKVLSALSGEDKPLSTASDLFLGGKISSYESDYLNYKSEKDKNEKIMEQLKRLGLVTQYTGYGYNSQGAALNEPNIEEYLKQLQLQQQ